MIEVNIKWYESLQYIF